MAIIITSPFLVLYRTILYSKQTIAATVYYLGSMPSGLVSNPGKQTLGAVGKKTVSITVNLPLKILMNRASLARGPRATTGTVLKYS